MNVKKIQINFDIIYCIVSHRIINLFLSIKVNIFILLSILIAFTEFQYSIILNCCMIMDVIEIQQILIRLKILIRIEVHIFIIEFLGYLQRINRLQACGKKLYEVHVIVQYVLRVRQPFYFANIAFIILKVEKRIIFIKEGITN